MIPFSGLSISSDFPLHSGGKLAFPTMGPHWSCPPPQAQSDGPLHPGHPQLLPPGTWHVLHPLLEVPPTFQIFP